jgi:transcriptional regulator with XRE-family HTH domain
MANQIRDAIRASGISQRQIAEQIGVTEAMVSRFLAGRSWLGERTFDALTDVLGLSFTAGQPKVRKIRKDE